MYILDTDHLSLIQRNNHEGKQIRARLASIENVPVAVTIITYEEQLRGRLNVLSKAKTLDKQVVAFDRVAGIEYQRLRKVYPRLGTMDLRIAAISIVKNANLLTRNTSDFGQIKELSVDEWSII
ncbi:MAG: type II toxin-antitoxin system VapC family toxin [Cyanobacteria bacterium J06642_3]